MQIFHRGLSMVVVAVALTACAAHPESIKAANYNSNPYAYLSCPQLAEYKAMLSGRLSDADALQEKARTEDIIGLVVGVGSVGSDSHRWTPWQISDLKGRIVAVERVETADNCGQQQVAARTR
ncbi:MAG TPA: hypothetical protein VGI20_09790 [Rhizomicrobium sp.]|jgi:hypothetical protein